MIYAAEQAEPTLEKEEKEREKTSPRGQSQDQSPWQRVYSSVGADHSSPGLREPCPSLGNADATLQEGSRSAQTPVLRKWGAGKVGVAWSPRTGGDISWRMRGQKKGRKWPRQLLNIWSHRELITQQPEGQWGWWGALLPGSQQSLPFLPTGQRTCGQLPPRGS